MPVAKPGYVYYKDTTPFATERANKSGYYPSSFAQEISRKAIDAGVDPWLALATAMKETNWGTATHRYAGASPSVVQMIRRGSYRNPFMSHMVHADDVNRRVAVRPELIEAVNKAREIRADAADVNLVSRFKKWWGGGRFFPPDKSEVRAADTEQVRIHDQVLRDELINNGIYQLRKNMLAHPDNIRDAIKRFNSRAKTDVDYTLGYMKDLSKNPEIAGIVNKEKVAFPRWEGIY